MRGSPRSRFHRLIPLSAVLLLAACGDTPTAEPYTAPTTPEAALRGPAAVEQSGQFIAHLTGAEEVDPVETRAQGQATFRLSADGSELSYRLMASNIENVMMAHIHVAPRGVNGAVVVWLYPEDGPPAELIPGRHNGILATGTITTADLVGPLGGEEAELADLVAIMREGGAYVNVHTQQFPGGEIRGQIR